MFINIINKQSFEFTCRSESTATMVQQHIESSFAMQVNTIIDRVFLEASQDNNLLKIDMLNIDLGDLRADDVDKPETLSKFTQELRQKILDPENRAVKNDALHKNNFLIRLSLPEHEIELIRIFILTGDVPWWVDKSIQLNVDAIIRKLLLTYPETLRKVLEELAGKNTELFPRLAAHINISTFLKILQTYPYLQGVMSNKGPVDDGVHLDLKMLSARQLGRLKRKCRTADDSSFEKLKQDIINLLLKSVDMNFNSEIFLNQPAIINLIALTNNGSILVDDNWRSKIETAMEELSIFQAEFLLFALLNDAQRNNHLQNVPFDSVQRMQMPFDENCQKMTTFILKKLKSSDEALIQHVRQLGHDHLKRLTSLFNKHVKQARERIRTRKYLLNHSFLFQNNILKFIAYLSSGTKKEPVSGVHSPAADLFIVNDIAGKGRFDTKNEKLIVEKMLHRLKDRDITLLKFLSALSAFELEKILPLSSFEPNKINNFFNIETAQKKIYIENAGICLMAVYFPHLFKRLSYLENGRFKNKKLALRAIFVLEYIVYGRTRSFEYLLQLNKLLCNFLIEQPIPVNITITKKEKQEADSLTSSIIQNWKMLKNTSVTGLRESFLQRKGILCENEKSWTLRIEKKGYDVILGTIPWSYNIIKLPWMKKPIEVEW